MDDKYLHYELNDYLEDDAFIKEVRNGHKNKAKWTKLLAERPVQSKVYNEAVLIISSIKYNTEKITNERVEMLWDGIREKVKETNNSRQRTIIRSLGITGIAAAIATIIFFVNIYNKHELINAFAGEQIKYTLPDASNLKLNAESSIRFNKKNFADKREVSMQGEVFFNIEKGRQFLVNAPLGKIQVLGTSFNVYSRDSLFSVTCYEGKVMVVSSTNDTSLLIKNEGISYDLRKGIKVANKFDSDEIKDWTKGVFRYDNERLDLIFAEVERQFDVEIIFEAGLKPAARKYTGMFTNDDLNKALYDICWPMHLSFEVNGKQVNIQLQ